eukprot:m51a1_g10648 hypothetical protein (513) ;mRNA; r:33579-35440
MVLLTESMVLAKGRVDSLDQVKNLNFWGNDLTDVSIIGRMPNLEVISLSVNRISTLKDFGSCPNLTEVYVRKNEISDLRELRWVQHLKRLRILWLSHNPCADLPDYRLRVISMLPFLQKLDNNDITAAEREAAKRFAQDADQIKPAVAASVTASVSATAAVAPSDALSAPPSPLVSASQAQAPAQQQQQQQPQAQAQALQPSHDFRRSASEHGLAARAGSISSSQSQQQIDRPIGAQARAGGGSAMPGAAGAARGSRQRWQLDRESLAQQAEDLRQQSQQSQQQQAPVAAVAASSASVSARAEDREERNREREAAEERRAAARSRASVASMDAAAAASAASAAVSVQGMDAFPMPTHSHGPVQHSPPRRRVPSPQAPQTQMALDQALGAQSVVSIASAAPARRSSDVHAHAMQALDQPQQATSPSKEQQQQAQSERATPRDERPIGSMRRRDVRNAMARPATESAVASHSPRAQARPGPSNVLRAVVLLLDDLDEESLRALKAEVEAKLERR